VPHPRESVVLQQTGVPPYVAAIIRHLDRGALAAVRTQATDRRLITGVDRIMFDTALEFWDYVWILVIVALAVSGLSRYLKPRERARLARLEAKVDLLLKQAGLAYDARAIAPAGVLEAVRQGRKIEAIKLYREATRADLQEAKDFVEELQASVRS